jgi:hypothetical protein
MEKQQITFTSDGLNVVGDLHLLSYACVSIDSSQALL